MLSDSNWLIRQLMKIEPLRMAMKEKAYYNRLVNSSGKSGEENELLQNQSFLDTCHFPVNYFRTVFFDEANERLVTLCMNNDTAGVDKWYQDLYSSENDAMLYDEYLKNRLSLRVIANYILHHYDKHTRILDSACGHGELDKYLVKKGYLHICGLDLNADRVNSLKETLASVRAESIESTAYEDESFDVILGFEMLEHVINLDQTLLSFRRLLKVNGNLILSTPYKDMIDCSEHVRLFDYESFIHMFNNYGFEIKAICRMPYLNTDSDNDIVAVCQKH